MKTIRTNSILMRLFTLVKKCVSLTVAYLHQVLHKVAPVFMVRLHGLRKRNKSASKVRRSFKDAGNVTEAKLTTSLLKLLLLLLQSTRPRAPDLIRVDDDVRQTNDASRLRRRRNTPLVRPPGRAALPAVTSPAGGRRHHVAAEGHAVLSSGPSASSSTSSSASTVVAAGVMISRWMTTSATCADLATRCCCVISPCRSLRSSRTVAVV